MTQPSRSDGELERRATDGLDWQMRDNPPPREQQPPQQMPPSGGHSGGRRTILVAAVAALLGAIIGGAIAGVIVATTGDDDNQSASGGDVTRLTVEQTSAVTDVAAKARPSVVKIVSTRRTARGTEEDIGSGIILDAQGHILTNAHVVLNTESLEVILSDGTQRKAFLIGHDMPFTDLAVLQISPGQLTPIGLGDSSKAKPGETVIAIGNPLAEFEGTVTVGVISGVNRVRIFDGVRQTDLIQTDAALNNGNSGGALVNLAGELIGMPTAVLREAGNDIPVEGIAFALPSNRLKAISDGIIAKGGRYPRPTLGLQGLDLLQGVTPPVRVAVDRGSVVTSVEASGPAATAGIAVGDVITKLGDVDITPDVPLLNALMKLEPGQQVKVVLNRNGRIIETEVRLATLA